LSKKKPKPSISVIIISSPTTVITFTKRKEKKKNHIEKKTMEKLNSTLFLQIAALIELVLLRKIR
jgi:hypothetical protein